MEFLPVSGERRGNSDRRRIIVGGDPEQFNPKSCWHGFWPRWPTALAMREWVDSLPFRVIISRLDRCHLKDAGGARRRQRRDGKPSQQGDQHDDRRHREVVQRQQGIWLYPAQQ